MHEVVNTVRVSTIGQWSETDLGFYIYYKRHKGYSKVALE